MIRVTYVHFVPFCTIIFLFFILQIMKIEEGSAFDFKVILLFTFHDLVDDDFILDMLTGVDRY